MLYKQKWIKKRKITYMGTYTSYIYKKKILAYKERIQYFKRLQWSIYHHLNPQVKKKIK